MPVGSKVQVRARVIRQGQSLTRGSVDHNPEIQVLLSKESMKVSLSMKGMPFVKPV